jgi:hypothetical protein
MKTLLFSALAALAVPMQIFALTSAELEANIQATTTGAGNPDFTIAAPSVGSGLVVDASAFGVSPTNTGVQNYTAFANAIAYCQANSAYKLTVPTGTYYIGDPGSVYAAILYFNGMHDFIFDAQGSIFLFQSKCYFIKVNGCSRVQFQNMTINWNWALEPVQSLTQVNAIDAAGNYMDLRFPYEGNPNPAANVYELVEVDGTNYNCSHQGMGVIGAWQMDFTRTANVATNIIRYYDNTAVVGNNWFHNNGARVGQYCVLRHYSYEAHGVYVCNNTNVTFTNNTMYSTLGMGYLWVNNQYYQILHSRMIREPGSLYHFSSAADGLHVANSFGYFKIQDVEIGNAGDDAINIHDTLSQGVTVTGSKTLIAQKAISWRNPYDVGSLVELRGKDFTPLGFSSTVLSRSYNDSAAQCTITFADALPANLDPQTILFNWRYNSGHYIVRGCNVHDNKVRGIFTHCANGTIENNQFIRNYCPGMFIACLATQYAEGFNPTNIIVRNNVFDGNDIFRNNFPDMPNNVVIGAETTPSGVVSYPICQNLIFENNTVKNCPYAALEVASATNVLIKNNTFINPNLTNNLATVLGCVMLLKCGGVVFTNNSLLVSPGTLVYKRNVSVDSAIATNNIFSGPFVSLSLAPGWTHQDIGSVGIPGDSGWDDGVFTVHGAGTDIWGSNDSFQFVYQPWSGDGQLIARVLSVENTDPWAKAGLMIRDSLAANSDDGILFLSPGNGVSLQGRTQSGGGSASISNIAALAAPCWLKVIHSGSHISGYQSADGTNWVWVGAQTNNMSADYYLGLAVTAKNNSSLNTALFDDVSVSSPWTYGHCSSISVANGAVILIVATNGLAGAPVPFVSTDLASAWTALQPGEYTSSYPATSNGTYTLTVPLPSVGAAFFKVGSIPP